MSTGCSCVARHHSNVLSKVFLWLVAIARTAEDGGPSMQIVREEASNFKVLVESLDLVGRR